MRRLLAITIVFLIVLPTVSPLFALASGGENPNLPICCRKDGKHHCMLADMDGMASIGSESGNRMTAATVTERCPYSSTAMAQSFHTNWGLQTAQAIFAGLVAHPSVAAQTESKRRISADRSRQKRGPPAAASA